MRPSYAEIPRADVRSVPEPALARPPPARQAARKERLNFRRKLEKHDLAPNPLQAVNTQLSEKGLLLKRGTIVHVTIIAAAPSTKTEGKARILESGTVHIRFRYVAHPLPA